MGRPLQVTSLRCPSEPEPLLCLMTASYGQTRQTIGILVTIYLCASSASRSSYVCSVVLVMPQAGVSTLSRLLLLFGGVNAA